MDVQKAREVIGRVLLEPQKLLFGQSSAVEKMALALFSSVPYDVEDENGRLVKRLRQAHVFLYDYPGVGKSLLMRAMAAAIGANFSLIPGEPTKEPKEITGGEIFMPHLGKFFLRKGPIFSNVILADEINRNQPKTQAPLLQAMEEGFVILTETDAERGIMKSVRHPLTPISDDPNQKRLFFWLIASANPIEQEGTYSIPEAVLDRFSFSFSIGFPPREAEKRIRYEHLKGRRVEAVTTLSEVLDIAELIAESVRTEPVVDEYITRLIENSRPSSQDPKRRREFAREGLARFIDDCVASGLSSRANLHFAAGVKTRAFMQGRDYASADDVKFVAPMVMSHRIVLSPYATRDVTTGRVVQEILQKTEVPS